MRHFLVVLGSMVALAGAARPADALTIRDIIELARAGLGEEVMLALIEVDRSVYPTDAATLKKLKDAGVSDRVLVALVRSGRETPVAPAPLPDAEPEPPQPQVVVIDHRDEGERVREVAVPVAVPVYIPVHTRRYHPYDRPITGTYDASAFLPFQSGPPAARPVQKQEPVYWGWGGQRRPDTWAPAPGEVKPPDRRK